MLSELKADHRIEPTSGAEEGFALQNGVTYHVTGSVLRGRWVGSSAEVVFNDMVRFLQERWFEHMRSCNDIAGALLSVGR
jgi:hypothetical protein